MQIELEQKKKADVKEMMSFEIKDGKIFAKVNFSSMDLINTCLRKTYYILDQKLKADNEAEALTFGKAIHKGLEHWYSLPVEKRDSLTPKGKEAAEMLGFGHGIEENYGESSLESIRQFVLSGDSIKSIPDTDKRSLNNGIKILLAYFKHYHDDKWVVLRDEKGPLIERQLDFILHDDDEMQIKFFGTIDVILKNIETGIIVVADHKTTASLGQQFFSRLKPNHQYTGYIMAAQKCLGIDTNLFMVNGLQVAKTKCEFARQITERNDEDFEELRIAMIDAVRRYALSKKHNHWPMNAPNPCSSYGNCQFIDVCSVPSKLKESVISSRWQRE